MEMASFAGFIQTLFYILFFYYVLKFLARLFLPYMVKKVVEKAGQNFQQQQQNQQNQSNTKESNPTDSKPRENKKVGEYVDFEEIE
jgi:bacteriorhodopsin